MGFGISTRASIEYLQAYEQGRYFLSDHHQLSKEDQKWLELRGITYEDGAHTHKVLQTKKILISPSVPPSHPMVCQAIQRGIPILTDLDLVADRISQKTRTVGITGTNGKTTTVEWLSHILNGASQAVSLGNIGDSPARFFLENPTWESPFLVFELSSYQLHYIQSFKVHIGVLLNITPDHLAWHGNLEAYRQDKLRILQCAKDAMIILNHTDLTDSSPFHGSLYTISTVDHNAACLIDLSKQQYIISTEISNMRLSFKGMQLLGIHNIQNGAAAAFAAALLEIPPDIIQKRLLSFTPSQHRLESFHRIGDTLFINDSKATNIDATIKAIRTFGNGKKNIVLLMGGCAKGESYLPLRETRDHVRIALVCGDNASLLAEALDGTIPYERFATWQELILQMRKWVIGDEVVLFSPGGSSFDFFQNYADRGEQFKAWIVREFPHQ